MFEPNITRTMSEVQYFLTSRDMAKSFFNYWDGSLERIKIFCVDPPRAIRVYDCQEAMEFFAVEMGDRNYVVEVCNKCYRAVCWHGEMMCDSHHNAGTVNLPAWVLDKLGLEHSCYYTKEHLFKITGSDEYKEGKSNVG